MFFRLFLCVFLFPWPMLQAGRVRVDDGVPVVELVIHNWVLPDATRSDPMSRANLAVVAAFCERYPEIVQERYAEIYRADPDRYGRHTWEQIRIEPRKFTGIRVEGVESDLLAIAGGVAPDVIYLNFRKSDTYIRNGFLEPLDPFLDRMAEGEFAERVHPKVLPVIRREGPENQVHTWALPYGGLLGKGLLYRKDRFDDAGLSYPDATWTWDDLMHAVQVLTDPAEGLYGIRLARGTDESYLFMPFLWSAGAEFMVRDPDNGRWTLEYDSPQAAVALDFYTRLAVEPWQDAGGVWRRGYAYRDTGGAWAKWQRGEIAMTQGYVDEEMLDVINPELTGLAPFPMGPNGDRGSEINSRMLALFRDIEDPVVRDAAWEFIRFFGSDEAQRIRVDILVRAGLAAFLSPDRLRQFGYDALVKLSPPGWTEVYDLAVTYGKPEPYGPNSNLVYTQLSLPLQEAQERVLNGQLPEEREARLRALQEILATSVQRARREMLGELPPEEAARQGAVSLAVLLALVAGYFFLIRMIVRIYARAAEEAGDVGRSRHRFWVAVLMLPALGGVTLWQVIPLLRGSAMAFQDYQILGESSWVGLRNFGEVLFDAGWWTAVAAAIRYTLWVMGLTFLPPLLLAVLLQETPWGRLFFRTVYYLPAVVSGLVMILMWKLFYEESENGLLNALVMQIPAGVHLVMGAGFALLMLLLSRRLWCQEMRKLAALMVLGGLGFAWTGWNLADEIFVQHGGWSLLATLSEPVRWLSDPDTAMFACVLPLAWAGMGPGCLVYLAALKGIDEDSYEAADLDGAGFLDKVLFIVVPRLKPLLLINFLGVFITAFFQAEANILAMTGGGADTNVAGLYIFQQAYMFLRFGPATAMAWLLGAMLIGFTLWQMRMLVGLEFRTTGSD
jgi:multiple sugar transport system permease protein